MEKGHSNFESQIRRSVAVYSMTISNYSGVRPKFLSFVFEVVKTSRLKTKESNSMPVVNYIHTQKLEHSSSQAVRTGVPIDFMIRKRQSAHDGLSHNSQDSDLGRRMLGERGTLKILIFGSRVSTFSREANFSAFERSLTRKKSSEEYGFASPTTIITSIQGLFSSSRWKRCVPRVDFALL